MMVLWLFAWLAAGGGALSPEWVKVEGVPPQRVQLSVSVLDRAGEPVAGLTATDFVVEEDGRACKVLDFAVESERRDRPLSAVFLVDRSGSIGRQLGRWRDACAALARALRPIDEVRLATFSSDVSVLQDFTSDPGLLAAVTDKLDQVGGDTDIFGAVDETLRDLRYRPGRKVIFLLTDGLDTLRSDVWSTENDAYLTGLVQQAVAFQTTVVTILPGPTSRPYLAAQDLAVQTGGWWVYPTDDLPGLVRKLGQRLLESYYIAYDSDRKPGERRRRRVEVRVTRPGLADARVRTVAGLFGDTALLDALKSDLDDGEENDRVRAAAALALLPDPRGQAPLVKALKDGSPRVRAAAAEALGRRGDPGAIRHIARLLRDDEPAVREAAGAAIAALAKKPPD